MKEIFKKYSVLTFLAIFIAGGVYFNPAEVKAKGTCESACNLYLTCTEKQNKRKATPSEKKQLIGGCNKTCSLPKYQKGILECFAKTDNSPNSCSTYNACIVSKSR